MSYLRKVEIQREPTRRATLADKERRKVASASGQKRTTFNPAPLQKGEESAWKWAIRMMSESLWKSKKTIAREAEVEKKRLEREAKEKVKAKV